MAERLCAGDHHGVPRAAYHGYPAPATPSALPTTLAPPPTETPVSEAVPTATATPPAPFTGAQLISVENVGSLKKLAQFQRGYEVYDITWSPDSRSVAVVNTVGLFILDLGAGKERQVAEATHNHRSEIAFSPDGKLLALAIAGAETRLFDVATGRLLRTFVDEGTRSVAFTPEGHILIFSTSHSELNLLDVETGLLSRTFTTSDNDPQIRQVALSPDGKLIAASTTGHGLYVWDVISGDVKLQTTVSYFLADPLIFSPDSKQLVLGDGSGSGGVQLWSINSGQMIFGANTQTATNGIALTPDGSVIAAAGGAPNLIEFWSVESKERIAKDLSKNNLSVLV